MAGIYFHIPFCRSKCGYCDFYSVTTEIDEKKLLHAYSRELEANSQFLGGQNVDTVYFGGGTPSLLNPRFIGELVGLTRHYCSNGEPKEITLEANPDDLDPVYLKDLRSSGINRLSIGIQSFHDERLRLMGRRHDSLKAVRCVEQAKKSGFDNISIDLIFGLSAMEVSEWEEDVKTAISLSVQHISTYALSIEPGTSFHKRLNAGALTLPDEATVAMQFNKLCELLGSAGFEHYEISNFALAGYRSVHNSNYWSGAPYLGLGPSAHSYDGLRTRSWNNPSLTEYLERPDLCRQKETLTDIDLYNEYVMTGLRRAEGINLNVIDARFGPAFSEYFLRNSASMIEEGNLVYFEGIYQIPSERFLISDSLIRDLFFIE